MIEREETKIFPKIIFLLFFCWCGRGGGERLSLHPLHVRISTGFARYARTIF